MSSEPKEKKIEKGQMSKAEPQRCLMHVYTSNRKHTDTLIEHRTGFCLLKINYSLLMYLQKIICLCAKKKKNYLCSKCSVVHPG